MALVCHWGSEHPERITARNGAPKAAHSTNTPAHRLADGVDVARGRGALAQWRRRNGRQRGEGVEKAPRIGRTGGSKTLRRCRTDAAALQADHRCAAPDEQNLAELGPNLIDRASIRSERATTRTSGPSVATLAKV